MESLDLSGTPRPATLTKPPISPIISCLLVGLLTACATQPVRQTDLQVTASPRSTTSPRTTAAPQTTRTTTQNQPIRNRYAIDGQTFTCQTANYFAQITWIETQPYLQFGRSPSDISLNTPANESQASNGDVIYRNEQGETNTSVRFEATGSCTIRVVGTNGTVTVNERGQAGGGGQSGGGQAGGQGYQDGYDRGYRQGYRDGRNARLYSSGYNPDAFFQSGSQSDNSDYDAGFREGYYKGFDDGYNSVTNPLPPRPQPLPEPLPDPGIPGAW